MSETTTWARPAIKEHLGARWRLTTRGYKPAKHRPRLVTLIEHMREVERRDPGSFHLATWVDSNTPDSRKKAAREWPRRWAAGEELNCGTSACLVGHLPLAFPDQFSWDAGMVYVLPLGWMGSIPSTWSYRLRAYFQLAEKFWWETIFQADGFWRGQPAVVTAGDMAGLLEEALIMADCEKPCDAVPVQ